MVIGNDGAILGLLYLQQLGGSPHHRLVTRVYVIFDNTSGSRAADYRYVDEVNQPVVLH